MTDSVAKIFRPLWRRTASGGYLALCLLPLYLAVACTTQKPDASRATRAVASSDIPPTSITDIPSAATAPATNSTSTVMQPSVSTSTSATHPAAVKTAATRVKKADSPKIAVPPPATAVVNRPVIALPPSTAVSAVDSPPTLNLAALERRLRDTRAIGVFAKLTLKNQVDDLLDEFRDFYRGTLKIPITALRQRYDLLMMKVLSLLQDTDAALAASIQASREIIWSILKDPKKFSQIRAG